MKTTTATKTNTRFLFGYSVMIALFSLTITRDALSQTIVNGSLTGTPGENRVPFGWVQYLGNTSDTANENGPFGTYNLSPDGGTFVRSFGTGVNHPQFDQQEGILQALSGLQIGMSYNLSFYQSSVNGINSITGVPFRGSEGFWELLIDGIVVDTSTPLLPPGGTSFDNMWTFETLQFQAMPGMHELALRAQVPASDVDARTFLLIDGISLVQVPEPGISALIVVGVVALVFLRMRKTPPNPR